MKVNEILVKFVNRKNPKHKPRQIGRYWASEIYAIKMGYSRPKDFFEQGEIDLRGAKNIISGIAYEDMLKKVFEGVGLKFKYGDETKYEIKINDEITVVSKLDFEFPVCGIETKYPTKETNEIPERYRHQLECEYRACKKDMKLGIFSYPFNVTYFPYIPSDETWEEVKKTLILFHAKLKLLDKKTKL